MRIITQSKDTITLQAETADDLWELSHIIEGGDVIKGKVERKIVIGDKTSEKARIERKTITLSIEVTKVDWQEEQLRILGTVREGTDDVAKGSHQSITVSAGTIIDITKAWAAFQKERLREATDKNTHAILLVLFDREEALFVLLRSRGYVVLSTLKGIVAKKAMKTEAKDFYKDIVASMQHYAAKHEINTIVIASPAFWNEYLLKEVPGDLRKLIVSVTCSSVDEQAILEVLRRPELKRVLEKDRTARETSLLAELKEHLAHRQAAYALPAVQDAIRTGNARTVLVTSTFLKKHKQQGSYASIAAALRAAEGMSANVHVLTTEDACKMLDGLGGIACLLRWMS